MDLLLGLTVSYLLQLVTDLYRAQSSQGCRAAWRAARRPPAGAASARARAAERARAARCPPPPRS